MSVALPISAIVNVAVSIGQTAAQGQNTTSLLALTSSTAIDMTTRMAAFSSLAPVGTFFDTCGKPTVVLVYCIGMTNVTVH